METTFHKKLYDWTVKPKCGDHSPGCRCLKTFRRIAPMKEWLRDKEAGFTETNEERLFKDIEPVEVYPDDPTSPELEGYTMVFSWLVDGYRGRYIRLFREAGFDDDKMRDPQHNITATGTLGYRLVQRFTEDFPDDSPDTLISKLEDTRWEFCPCLLSSEFNAKGEVKPFGDKLYMPFCRQKSVAEQGGTAQVFLAQIQEEFVSEDIKRYLGPPLNDKRYRWCYRLAIKRLSEIDWVPYDQERRTFKGVRDKRGILRCLGFYSFTDNLRPLGIRYNILLEHAEMSLHDLFKGYNPPQLAEEIYSHWNAFCQIIKAIETLHGFDPKGAKWSGWHGDIKPRNVLLVGKEWKLADYGFAVFRAGSPSNRPVAKLSECTQTWGAPETVDHDNLVAQTVDTWSFGCVLSVMATWMVRGYRGVREFEEYRSQATKRLKRTDHPADAFHDGENALPHIKRWHKDLKDIRRHSDEIPDKILDIVDKHLLLKDAQQRSDSAELRERLGQVINTAKESLLQRDGELCEAKGSVRLGLDGDKIISFNLRSHPEDDDTNWTRSTSTAMDTRSEQVYVPEVESRITTPTLGVLVDPQIPELSPSEPPEDDTLVDPRPDLPSQPDLPPTGDVLDAMSSPWDPTPTLAPLAPSDSNRNEAIMDHVWESAKEPDGGYGALKAYLTDEKFWIADRTHKDGYTRIMVAAKSNNLKVVKLLAKHSNLSCCDKNGKTVLHHLIWTRRGVKENPEFVELVESILGSRTLPETMFSLIDWPDGDTCTPIMIAARENHLETSKLFAEHSDLSPCDQDGKTVLHHLIGAWRGKAETNKFVETMRYILDHNTTRESISSWINQPDNDEHTCLFLCVDFGNVPRTTEELLRKGATIDVTGIRVDNTPLAEAVRRGTEHMIKMMLKDHVVARGVSAKLREHLQKNRKSINASVWRLIVKAELCDAESSKLSRWRSSMLGKRGN